MIVLELLACGWCWWKLVHPVPRLTADSYCHSLLLVELFIDAFTFFPQVLFGLATLVWMPGLGFSVADMPTLCYNQSIYLEQLRDIRKKEKTLSSHWMSLAFSQTLPGAGFLYKSMKIIFCLCFCKVSWVSLITKTSPGVLPKLSFSSCLSIHNAQEIKAPHRFESPRLHRKFCSS